MSTNLRPTLWDERVLNAAAQDLAHKVIKHDTQYGDIDEIDQIIKDIRKCIRHDADGYAIAKNLDNYCGWLPDAGLVEVLDDCSSIKYSNLKKLEEEWIKTAGLSPATVGANVHDKKNVSFIGTVVKNDENIGYAYVHRITDPPGSSRLVPWENIEYI